MKAIQSITATAVVLMFVLSAFAGTAAADPTEPEHDGEEIVPGGGVAYDAPPEDRFLKAKKAFDEHENFPDSIFDGDVNKNFPDSIFDGEGNENFPDSIFDGSGDEVEEGPVFQG